jgi:hypothetical protein
MLEGLDAGGRNNADRQLSVDPVNEKLIFNGLRTSLVLLH